MKKWEIKESSYIVNNRWLKLRADSCLTEEGYTIEPYYVFEYPDWVNCFVIDSENQVIMLKHYRHGIQENVLEIIAGAIEATDKSALDAIKRELREELGYIGGEIYQTGITYANPSNHSNKVYSFLAFGGTCSEKQNLEKSENLTIKKFTIDEIVQMFTENTSGQNIFQSLHISSFYFALQFIRKSSIASLNTLKLKFSET